jgi:hypothetical protein
VKDAGKPFRLGDTVISHDAAYLRLALRTILPPTSRIVVLDAVNERTTGSGVAPKASCGTPRSTIVATTTGTVTAIASFDRALERDMGYLASLATVLCRQVLHAKS